MTEVADGSVPVVAGGQRVVELGADASPSATRPPG